MNRRQLLASAAAATALPTAVGAGERALIAITLDLEDVAAFSAARHYEMGF